mmetsp:Transcript_2210/g.4541  ORF Transcript_2210/g.4541 Transcript_2210/m.4541 type:complete len:200 (+) Transcript_2210:298-897(+)
MIGDSGRSATLVENLEVIYAAASGEVVGSVAEGVALLQGAAAAGLYTTMAQRLDTTGQTLVHMDARGGNVFVRDGECCLYDWQNVSRGNGCLDLAYFLASSLTVQDRRATEQALVSLYSECASVAEGEVAATLAMAFLWPVVWAALTASTGLEQLTEFLVPKNEDNEKAHARTRTFLAVTTVRFIQAAVDWNSLHVLQQ